MMETRLKALDLANEYLQATTSGTCSLELRLKIATSFAQYLEGKDCEPAKNTAVNGMILNVFQCCGCKKYFYTPESNRIKPIRCPLCEHEEVDVIP